MRYSIIAVLATAVILQAGEINVFWELPGNGTEVKRSVIGEYFHIEGIPNSGRPGDPSLPLAPLYVVLPQGAVADAVYITDFSAERIPGVFDIKPCQSGVPLSRPEDFSLTPVNPDAYTDDFELPIVTITGQGGLMGYNVVNLAFRPVSWSPSTGAAEVFTSAVITVHYRFEDNCFNPAARSETGERIASEMVRSLVLNPQDVRGSGAIILPEADLVYGDYLIIADDDLIESFEPLAELKTLKGIPASIVATSYIDDVYTGVDLAQKIRCFLRTIYDSGPPTFILIAGDTPGVPHRNCWATAEGYVSYPAADIYYQDMNDTVPGIDLWDANGNGVWGEIDIDVMDYHPDYLIGRASVETTADADVFVAKVLAWEDGCDSDAWFTSMGFTTGILWSSPFCPGSAGKEKVDTLYTPATWTIEKHYESEGTQSYAQTMSMLNRGMQLVNHAGHGSNTSVSIGTGSLGCSDFMGLTNISDCDRPSIWNTIACNSGAFDQGSCLAEAWIRSPNGGGFCMMNTRYGWGEPSEPGDQWSELVDQEFFAKFFVDDLYLLGEAHAMAKDEFIALIPSDTHYDWIAKSLTLFGDPELPMWDQVPAGVLESTGPDVWFAGMMNADITVADSNGPVDGARVCILQGEWDDPAFYAVEFTDGMGTASFTGMNIPANPPLLSVTCWARNHSPVSVEYIVQNTSVEGTLSTPGTTYLLAPSPNPSSGSVTFHWGVTSGAPGVLTIHDLSGRMVSVVNDELEGTGAVIWNQTAEDGQSIPAGIYFARLSREGFDPITRKIVLIR